MFYKIQNYKGNQKVFIKIFHEIILFIIKNISLILITYPQHFHRTVLQKQSKKLLPHKK